jgi:hypothetical protein
LANITLSEGELSGYIIFQSKIVTSPPAFFSFQLSFYNGSEWFTSFSCPLPSYQEMVWVQAGG